MNIARIIYDNFPSAAECLPEEVADDLEKMYRYVRDTDPAELGDSLLRFVVMEAWEGGRVDDEGKIDPSLVHSLLNRGINDLYGVICGIEGALDDEI